MRISEQNTVERNARMKPLLLINGCCRWTAKTTVTKGFSSSAGKPTFQRRTAWTAGRSRGGDMPPQW